MLSGRLLSYLKKRKISRNGHSLSFVVTRCHSLSFVVIHCLSSSFVVPLVVTRCHSLSLIVPLVVTRCTTRFHSLSLVVICCYSLYHSLSLVVTRLPLVCLLINDRVTSLPNSFSDWLLEENISLVMFYYLTKFHCLVAFTSWDIGQYVYCNYLLTRFWRHEFWN